MIYPEIFSIQLLQLSINMNQEEFICPIIGEIDGIWICQVSFMDLIL
jgi:hypothetical protein